MFSWDKQFFRFDRTAGKYTIGDKEIFPENNPCLEKSARTNETGRVLSMRNLCAAPGEKQRPNLPAARWNGPITWPNTSEKAGREKAFGYR
jgi:hypothetical protein